MLRDERGHRVGYADDGFVCMVPEHEPQKVIDLQTATLVWERGQKQAVVA